MPKDSALWRKVLKFENSGFTLIELLITVVIIGVLSTIGFANYQTFAATQKLNDAASQVQSLLRTAQTNATAGVKCVYGTNRMTAWMVVLGSDSSFSLLCQNADNPQGAGNVKLSLGNITIPSITSGGSTCITPFSVTYGRLYGNSTLTDNSSCNNVTSVTVTLKYTSGNTSLSKQIIISQGGGINVQ